MPLKNANMRQKDTKSSGRLLLPKHNSPRAPYNKPLIATQQLKKPRSYEQRLQKKSLGLAGKENDQQLVKYTTKAILLTPSSSDNSLTTSLSSERVINCTVLTKDIAKTNQSVTDNAVVGSTPYLSVKRQKSAAILCFRSRKSLSQMDFKDVRRSGNSQMVPRFSSPGALKPAAANDTATSLIFTLLEEAQLISEDWQVQQVLANIRFQVDRAIQFRMLNCLLLLSLRRRRIEAHQLREQMEDGKRSYVKIRNQLHVCSMVFSVDKRQNGILNDKLEKAQRCISNQDQLIENLKLMFEQTKEEKEKLTQKLTEKEEENENLQQLLDTAKNDLFHANTKQREQLEELTEVEREYQTMVDENCDLNKELEVMSLELTLKTDNAEQLRKDVANISHQLSLALQNLKQYKRLSEEQMKEQHDRTVELQHSIQQKEEQLTTLENCLAATVGQRIRRCLNHTQTYQELHHVIFERMVQSKNPTLSQPSVNPRRTVWGIFVGQMVKCRRMSNTLIKYL